MTSHPVMTMQKRLTNKDVRWPAPAPALDPNTELIRPYQGPEDIEHWLAIRTESFSGQLSDSRREWNRADFDREFREHFRLLFALKPLVDGYKPSVVGSIAIQQIDREQKTAHLNWLMVMSAYRCKGLGTNLVLAAENTCRQLGIQSLRLTTLTTWKAAVDLYQQLGYEASNRTTTR